MVHIACSPVPNPGDTSGPDPTNSTERSRRPHRKSRTGCRACKARRVKCDEKQPTCGGCSRRSIQCYYFHPFSPNQDGNGPSKICIPRQGTDDAASQDRNSLHDSIGPSPTPSSPLEPVPITTGTPFDRLIELRLFHHFHEMTIRAPGPQHMWSAWVTELAVKTPSVMDALLGFSAFHLRRLNDSDPEIREASHKYMASAIRSHLRQIELGFNPDTASTLLASGAFIIFHTSVNQSYITDNSGYQPPVHWFRPFHSAATYFSTRWHNIRDTDTCSTIERFLQVPPVIVPISGPRKFEFLLEGIESEGLDDEAISAYDEAVTYLSLIYRNPGYPKLLRFPTLVSVRFIELLEAKEPRALAIIGYFFMMVKGGKLLWWVDGSAEREFNAIMAFLPKQWRPVMDWAVREFGWDGSA